MVELSMVVWCLVVVLLPVVVGGIVLLACCVQELSRPRVVCLMYHRLASREAYQQITGTERIFALPVDEFERQVCYLKEAGYTFVSPEQVERIVARRLEPPGSAVLITFDDGCRSVAELGVPILKKHAVQATLFVTTDPDSHAFKTVGDADRRLTDEELRALDPGTVHIASHAVTHRPLRGLAADEIRRELESSKRELERILSRDVDYFAVPGNWFDRNVMRIAQEVGYKAVWCSNPGTVRGGSDLFKLPRVNVEGQLTLPQFIAALSPVGIAKRRIASGLKRAPGRLLGPRYWLPLRKVIMACIPGGYLSNRRVIAIGSVLAGIAVFVAIAVFLYVLM